MRKFLVALFLLVAVSASAVTYIIGEQADNVSKYHTNLTDASVVFLSNLASFTPPCQIMFVANNDYYWGAASTTIATIDHPGNRIGSGTSGAWSVMPRTKAFNLGFWTATGTAASLTITVIPIGGN
jgi:hypothetical protein